MNLLFSSNNNPYWNLATEDFLLKNSREDFLLLYLNQPCVVVGKHQIAPKEINSLYTSENKILIARRLSGGGAVYHDEGNLNFSFVRTVQPGENISYKILTQPVMEFLKFIGVEAELSDRNDIELQGKKISGSAMHVFKSRVLAHCTLLIDCNIQDLSNALRANSSRYEDKSISSKRAEVINLSEIDAKFKPEYILEQFVHFAHAQKILTNYQLSEGNCTSINDLVNSKFSNPEWIYGYSPRYTYTNSFEVDGDTIKYSLEVEKGVINVVSAKAKNSISYDKIMILKSLKGIQHNIYSIKEWGKNQVDGDSLEQIIVSLF